MYFHCIAIDTPVSPANRGLKSSAAATRRRAFKTKTTTMNNFWSQEYSQLRGHAQYNVKLSIMIPLRMQREIMLRRKKYFGSHLIADGASF